MRSPKSRSVNPQRIFFKEDDNTVTESILRRVAAGDRAAVQECISVHGALVWALARRFSPTQTDAEDAVQEIFIDLWKYADRFDESRASESTYVAMVARRRLTDRYRQRKRIIEDTTLSTEPPLAVTRHDRVMEMNADAARATRALSGLRPEQQQVLRLSIYHGMSHQEISDATGISLGTVKTYIRRGLMSVREALGIRQPNLKKESLL
jgi:RNA polymerase sigma factor (sigma-70 family)